jgi:membrane-associated phospholipid phosphatase
MSLRVPIVIATIAVSSCATLPRDYRSAPTARQWRQSATAAAKDPRSWVPAAAALAIAVSGRDHDISADASREAHVFGSREDAEERSNSLKGAAHVIMLATALLPNDENDPFATRLAIAAANEVTTVPNALATAAFKKATGRSRPDESDEYSLPSGHASVAASYAAVSAKNLENARVSDATRRSLLVVSELLVAGTAWARVEAGKHYLTDVLAGAALGNLVTRTIDRAFRDRGVPVTLKIRPAPGGAAVWFTVDARQLLRH